jgi:mediator of RNA polymerase II transcription subunit 6
MATSEKLPLDEIVWSDPIEVNQLQGIHSNSVLYYFAKSPFFDNTSNNNVVFNQALHNPKMFPIIQTREQFEGRLKSMSGLEFIVAQEPAEMGWGYGTGVWVIRKQTRRKQPGAEDELTVHADYFLVGENIYQAPTLADILSSKIVS